MSELSRDALLGIVRDVYERHDPVPDHLVAGHAGRRRVRRRPTSTWS